MTNKESIFLTTRQAAVQTGFAIRTIQRHLKDGKYPNAFRSPQFNHWLIPANEIQQKERDK